MRTALWAAFMFLFCACSSNEDPAKKAQDQHAAHAEHFSSMTDYATKVNNGEITEDTMKSSPRRTAMRTIHGTHIHIDYGSPGVKGRVIWGGLVAYDQVWAAGAHNASTVNFTKPVMIDQKEIPAGTYAFFAIPGKEKWTLLLNSKAEQHLADDYDPKLDVVKMEVSAEACPFTPRLTYSVISTGKQSGLISLQWEKLKVELPFTTN